MQTKMYNHNGLIHPARKHQEDHGSFKIWCGGEGWMSISEMLGKTADDIAAYAKMQPLRYRSAMVGRRMSHAASLYRKPVSPDLSAQQEGECYD